MEFLDDTIGEFITKSAFKKTPILYELIALICKNQFGFKNDSKNRKITLKKSDFKTNAQILSNKIINAQKQWRIDKKTDQIDEVTFNAFTTGTNTKENRDIVIKFIEHHI